MRSSDLRRQEFEALRETIRTRGSIRAILCWASIVAWAALAVTVGAMGPAPLAWILPLVALAGGFEAVFGLHTAVERIGRYLQVFYETGSGADGPDWETRAMAYGQAFPKSSPDPLAGEMFLIAGFINLLGLFSSRLSSRAEAAVLSLPHVIFFLRVIISRRRAAAQRVRDLERFRKLKNSVSHGQTQP